MQFDFRMVVLSYVFHNGKPQPGAAGGFGAAFVHSEKSFKNTGLELWRNADAGVFDSEDCTPRPFGNANLHGTIFHVILDGVVA